MKLFKRLTSFLLTISIVTSISLSPVSAATSENLTKQNTEQVTYIGDNKLVIFENDSIVKVTQYDKEGNLIEECTYNKNTKRAKGYNDKKGKHNLNLPKITVQKTIEHIENDRDVSILSKAPSGYEYITSVQVLPDGELSSHNMKVYYDYNYIKLTTYAVRSWEGTLAALVLGVVVALKIPAVAAEKWVNECVRAGICIWVGEKLSISSTRSWVAKKYSCDYYSEDTDSSKDFYYNSAGYKYIIIDEDYTGVRTTYYEDYPYCGINTTQFHCACDLMATNIYGVPCTLNFD